MVDDFLGIDEPATIDKRIDAERLVVGPNTVYRERIQVVGDDAADIALVTAANGLEVDVTRILPGTGALHLGKIEDAPHASGDVGVLQLGVRNDAGGAMAGDQDYHPHQFDASGRLRVVTQGGAGGTSAVDDSVFTVAVDSLTPAGAFFGDAVPDSVNDGDVGVLRMSTNRNLYGTIRDAAGNERGANVTAANALVVDGSAVTQPISAAALPLPAGAATSALQLADGHNVTVDNAAGAAAVNIQDGGNVITIDNDDVVSANNSSVATLGIAGNFTGPGDDLLGYTSISVQIDASHDGAVDGMTFEFSTDNVNWDDMFPFTYTAADGARRFQFPVTARYFRVNYTNGGTGQTHFRLQTILHRQVILTTIHRLADAIDPDRSSTLVKSAIIAQADGSGDFITVDATAGGNLKVSVEEFNGVAPSLGSGAVDAGTLRVVLPTDQPVVSIDDNASSLTVDAPVATPVNVQISDGIDTALVSGAGALIVDGSAVTQPVSAAALPLPAGAATSALQLADGHNVTVDNAIGDPVQVEIGDGVETALVTAAGELNVIATAQPGTDIGDVTINNTSIQVVGDIAHDSPDAGANPVKVGGRAVSTLPAAVAADDRVDAIYTTQGAATVAGIDGTTPRGIAVNASGQLEIDIAAQQGSALEIVGDVAADAPGSAINPVILAGIAQEVDATAPPNRVSAEDDAAYLSVTRDGSLFVAGPGPQQWHSYDEFGSAQTDTSIQGAPGANLQLMITDIYFAAEDAEDFILEADDVADVPLFKYYASGEGDGVAISFNTPIPVGANLPLTFTSIGANNHVVVVNGFIQPI